MRTSWRFITARPIPGAADLGGTEQCIQYLGAALAARGHLVAASGEEAAIDVAINDARLLPPASRRPVIWFHNEVSFWRELRRRRLPALLRHRPTAIFCGVAQAHRAGPFLPFRSRIVLPHGLPAAILAAAPAPAPPPPHALFISQAYRGLAEVISLWSTHIAPALPAARLSAHIQPTDIPRFQSLASSEPSIAILPRVANTEMPALLRTARLLFAPGHQSETFCLSAAEAIAMGVPVVTRGIGALKERVRHGFTGHICRTQAEMARHGLALLTDDALWSRMHANGLATRHGAGWDDVAQKWETTRVEPHT